MSVTLAVRRAPAPANALIQDHENPTPKGTAGSQWLSKTMKRQKDEGQSFQAIVNDCIVLETFVFNYHSFTLNHGLMSWCSVCAPTAMNEERLITT